MKTYYIDPRRCRDLINDYIKAREKSPELQIVELGGGCCGCGSWIIYDINNKYKSCLISEYYINEWSSGQKIKMYKSYEAMPKRIKLLIESGRDLTGYFDDHDGAEADKIYNML